MNIKNTTNKINYTLNCNGKLVLIQKPIVMGIVNITPDSFYNQSSVQQIDAILEKIATHINEGATIVDIGAQSTRPNSTLLTHNDEWLRLQNPLAVILKTFPHTIFSIDTFYSQVANNAVALGAHIINDISGGNMDDNMISTVGKLKVPYICMHMQGTPQTMQQNPTYNDVTNELLDYFVQKKIACTQAGIKDVIIDFGFGFGKNITHNYTLLSELHNFNTILQSPLLVGVSRKSMIYKPLNITPEESLNGTTVLHTIALQQGASILRVHDVKPAIEAISLMQLLHQ
jgi:dihydropteroate synthase